MRSQDDGQRGTDALVISVRDEGDRLELTFDIARHDGNGSWRHQRFITFAEIPKDSSGVGTVPARRLEDFAALVLTLLPGRVKIDYSE
jgi:hypothetical protein